MTAKDHILASAELRGRGKFKEAIAEIENNRSEFDEISLLPALLQAFYAADKLGDSTTATKLAKEIISHDPDIPSVKSYLT